MLDQSFPRQLSHRLRWLYYTDWSSIHHQYSQQLLWRGLWKPAIQASKFESEKLECVIGTIYLWLGLHEESVSQLSPYFAHHYWNLIAYSHPIRALPTSLFIAIHVPTLDSHLTHTQFLRSFCYPKRFCLAFNTCGQSGNLLSLPIIIQQY